LAHKLGVEGAAGLRKVDAARLTEIAAQGRVLPSPTVDGRLVPHQLVEVFDRGEQARVPLLAGFNSGEVRSLRMLTPPLPADAASYEKQIRERYVDLGDAFLQLYPSSAIEESVLAAVRDASYGWTAERLVIKQSALDVPAFLYYFDHGYGTADAAGLHAFHASELPYLFDTAGATPPLWPKVPAEPAESQFSAIIREYWSSFASSGVPRAAGQPPWPAYAVGRAFMRFAAAPTSGTHLLPGMYELHESVVCRRRLDGRIAWNWNVGLNSPPLPPGAAQCR
jgi:para-nitrobenzyl esterase